MYVSVCVSMRVCMYTYDSVRTVTNSFPPSSSILSRPISLSGQFYSSYSPLLSPRASLGILHAKNIGVQPKQ